MDIKEIIKGLEKDQKSTMDDKLVEILLKMMDRRGEIDLNTLLGLMLIRDMIDKSKTDNIYLSLLQNEIRSIREELSRSKESKPSATDEILKLLITQYLQGNITSKDLISAITSMSQNMVQTYKDVYEKLYEKSAERDREVIDAVAEKLSELKESIRDLEKKYEELSSKKGSLEEISEAINKINKIYQASKEIDNVIKQYKLEKEPIIKEGQINVEKLLDLAGKFLSLLSQQRPAPREIKPPEIETKTEVIIPEKIPEKVEKEIKEVITEKVESKEKIPSAPVVGIEKPIEKEEPKKVIIEETISEEELKK